MGSSMPGLMTPEFPTYYPLLQSRVYNNETNYTVGGPTNETQNSPTKTEVEKVGFKVLRQTATERGCNTADKSNNRLRGSPQFWTQSTKISLVLKKKKMLFHAE